MPPHFRSFALVLALCGGVIGCGPSDEPPEPAPAGERSAVLGTGQAAFEPIEGEPELALVAGTQGGFHVWASFLAYGFSAPLIGMLLTTSVDGVLDSRIVMRANLSTRPTSDIEGNPARTFAGFPAQIYDARCANGRRVELVLTLTDESGDVAEDTRHCIASVAPELQSKTCE